METDRRQLLGKKKLRLLHLGSEDNRGGGGGAYPPFFLDTEAPVCPQLSGSQDLHSCQITKNEREDEPQFLASRPTPTPVHRLPSVELLEQADLLALRPGALGGLLRHLPKGTMSLEVNPRVLATRGQFGPVFCHFLSGKPGWPESL